MMRVKNHQSPATIRVENALNKTILYIHGFSDELYYTVRKRLVIFPPPAGISLTKLSLAGHVIKNVPGRAGFGK
jgi:hypothetical protein